ncbi:MAG: radical SAM protein [Candidatus Methanomethylophilaceae archaeon]|nr:radical SAM protein [Candidatus Methanomethylophilaceae archaeon]NLF33435.1 radical SAM protein [Thermoplasmatales archaeon]
MSLKRLECGSAANGPLAEGCEHCMEGAKMVLLITGKCDTGCFYCPVSFEKKGLDVIYANEKRVFDMEGIFGEAVSMDATGTGITGGDPLEECERTARAIEGLKGRFGKGHHIHLYTSTMDPVKVRTLAEAGLDEIRFHPPVRMWTRMEETALKDIVGIPGLDVGLEVPALPDRERELDALLVYAESVGVRFVNLNELEFSESNWDMMGDMGYGLKDELSSAVEGSEGLALRLIKRHRRLPVHFCSSSFKDGVQLRRRLIRRANHIARDYDIVTEDGTLLKGVLYAEDLAAAEALLSVSYDVPAGLMHADPDRKRLEVASWVLERLAAELPYECFIVEEYPTADRLEVERMPLRRRDVLKTG